MTVKRLYLASALAYVTLAVICYRVPISCWGSDLIGRIWEYVWLAGPPANLLHGDRYLGPFVLGTAILACLALIALRVHRWRVRLALWSGIAALWCLFGGCVYVPTF